MRFASSWGASLSRKDAALAYNVPAWRVGKPYNADWNLERSVSEAMGRVIWVFRAVHTIADNQARLPIQVRRDHPESGELVLGHPLLNLVGAKPNPYERAYFWRYRLSCQVLLSKKGAFVEIIRDRTGRPVALYLLPPGKTSPIPHPATFISGYEVDLGAEGKRTLPLEDVSWIRLPHPIDPYSGMTPMEAAGISVDIDVLARLFNRNFLANDGRLGGIVAVKGEMDGDTLDELERRFNPGASGAGRVTAIESESLNYIDLARSPSDSQHSETRTQAKQDILSAFGVPESIATGNAADRTFSNADAEIEIFWQSTMLGHCALLSDGIDFFDPIDSNFFGFDFAGVEALQRAANNRHKNMLAEYQAGARTLDDYLVATGRQPVGTPESRSYYLPIGLVPTATEGPIAPVLPLARTRRTAELPVALEAKALLSRVQAAVEIDHFAPLRKVAAARFDAGERDVHTAARAYFVDEEGRTLARLRSARLRRGTRHWDFGSEYDPALPKKAVDAERVYDLDRGRAEAEASLLPVLREVMLDAAKAATPLTKAADFNPDEAPVSAELASRANRIKGIADTTWVQIRDQLIAGEAAGESIDDLAKRVETVFTHAKGYRARLIARTEVVSASNSGSLYGATQAGATSKSWLAAHDERVRATHKTADGQTVDLGDSFQVGDASLRYPGDPSGLPTEVIQCRCSITYSFD